MIYNGDTNNQDLVSLLNDLTGMDNNVYTLNAKTRDTNTANRTIWSWIHEAYGGWFRTDGVKAWCDKCGFRKQAVHHFQKYGGEEDAAQIILEFP